MPYSKDTTQADEFLTPKEARAILKCSEGTLYHEIAYGSLKPISFRLGRQYRISAAGLRALVGDN